MKKYILPVLALALLTGCGKVSEVKDDDRPINIVSGTVEGTAKVTTTTESDDDTVSGTTTDKAGNKVSGTTTTTSAGSKKSAVTRANGGSGGVYGTTRAVPVAPKNNNTKKTTTTAATTTQPVTQTPSFNPKDCSSISFGYSNSTPNKIEVSREYSDGNARSYQTISADTSEIQKALEKDPAKTINDFVIKSDLDFDGYPDIFIVEKPDGLNKTGKYYHYDPENGNYQPWSELNGIKVELSGNESDAVLKTVEKKDDVEYEEKTYKWNEQKQLVMIKYMHKYRAGDTILIDYVDYDANGAEILRETRDENGNLVGGNTANQAQGE